MSSSGSLSTASLSTPRAEHANLRRLTARPLLREEKTLSSVLLPHVCGFGFVVLLLLKLRGREVAWRVVFVPLFVADAANVLRHWPSFAAKCGEHIRAHANILDVWAVGLAKIYVVLKLEKTITTDVLTLLSTFWILTLASALVRGYLAVAKRRGACGLQSSSSSSNAAGPSASAAAAPAPATPPPPENDQGPETEVTALPTYVTPAPSSFATTPAHPADDDDDDDDGDEEAPPSAAATAPEEEEEEEEEEESGVSSTPPEEADEATVPPNAPDDGEDHSDDNTSSTSSSRSSKRLLWLSAVRRVLSAAGKDGSAFFAAAAIHVVARCLQPYLIALKLDDRLGVGDESWGVVLAPLWTVLGSLGCVAVTLCNCAPLLAAGMPERVRRRAVKLVTLCATQLLVVSAAGFASAYLLAKRLDSADTARERYRDRRDDCFFPEQEDSSSSALSFFGDNATTTTTTTTGEEDGDSSGCFRRNLPSAPTATAILLPVVAMYAVLFALHPLVVRDSRKFQQIVRLVVVEGDRDRNDDFDLDDVRAQFDLLTATQNLVGVDDDTVLFEQIAAPTRLLQYSSTLYARAGAPTPETTTNKKKPLVVELETLRQPQPQRQRPEEEGGHGDFHRIVVADHHHRRDQDDDDQDDDQDDDDDDERKDEHLQQQQQQRRPQRHDAEEDDRPENDDEEDESANVTVVDVVPPATLPSPRPAEALDDDNDDDDAHSSGSTTRPRRSSPSALCYICCVRERDSLFLECGHGGLCYDCGKSCATKHPRRCPICREPIAAVLRLGNKEAPGSRYVVAEEGVLVRTSSNPDPSPSL